MALRESYGLPFPRFTADSRTGVKMVKQKRRNLRPSRSRLNEHHQSSPGRQFQFQTLLELERLQYPAVGLDNYSRPGDIDQYSINIGMHGRFHDFADAFLQSGLRCINDRGLQQLFEDEWPP